jgi:hypothetical protein
MAKDTISYSWNCRLVDCYPTKDDNTDVVYNVHWTYTGTSSKKDDQDNFYTASIYGTQVLNTDDITDFIPFTDLDNAKVTDWVTTTMGEDKVNNYKTNLSNQIADQITPRSITLEVKE